MIFYKVPIELVSPEVLRGICGSEQTYLNPVLDVNDDWVVSKEEWDYDEFKIIKLNYPEIAAAFVEVDTTIKEYPELNGV